MASRPAGEQTRDPAPDAPDAPADGLPEPIRDVGSAGIDIAAVRSIKIGRYKVIGLIGAGGMGIVYAARDLELGRRVAIKVLRPEMSADLSQRKTLIAEAKAMARLSHPNVCTVYEVGTTENSVFLAMEYVDGRTLTGWLGQEPRTWQQVVEVMLAVGQGVEAAHAAGIVHRDLKPENVLIGRDGRVRVMDFGIATGAPLMTGDGGASESRQLSSFSTLVGTPSYMAPELLDGARADALSDQFAYATTFYEALYGRRPYQGHTFGELLEAYEGQDVHEPTGKQAIPRWLRQVVLRGVAVEPGRRYASVGAMVAELQRVPRVRRIWQLSGLALLLAIFGVLLTIFLFQKSLPAKNPCLGAEARIASMWGESQREGIERALGAAGIVDAAGQWQRVVSLLDIYTDKWAAMYTEACEATRVRGEQSDAMLDRRMLCLDARTQELDELVSVLRTADRGVAQRAVQAVLALEDVDTCSARRDLLDAPPEPDDPEVRAELEVLRGRLAVAKVLYDLGRYAQVRAEAAAIAEDARKVGYAPLVAAARLLEGRVLLGLDELKRAEGVLIEAWLAAERSSDDRGKLAALSELVMLLGFESRRHEDAQRWLTYAESTLVRVGDAPRLAASLLRARNGLIFRTGAFKSYEMWQQTYEVALRGYGQKHPMVALTLNDMATAALFLGHQQEALAYQKRALAAIAGSLGEQHPMAADIINNLGNAYYRAERLDDARAHYERALSILESFFGGTHSRVAVGLSNLGNVYSRKEEYSEAIAAYQRALAIEEELHGKDHPNSVITLLNLGTAYLDDFETDRALPYLQRASAIVADARTGEAADVRYALARALFANAEEERALELGRQALAMFVELGDKFAADRKEVAAWLLAPN